MLLNAGPEGDCATWNKDINMRLSSLGGRAGTAHGAPLDHLINEEAQAAGINVLLKASKAPAKDQADIFIYTLASPDALLCPSFTRHPSSVLCSLSPINSFSIGLHRVSA